MVEDLERQLEMLEAFRDIPQEHQEDIRSALSELYRQIDRVHQMQRLVEAELARHNVPLYWREYGYPYHELLNPPSLGDLRRQIQEERRQRRERFAPKAPKIPNVVREAALARDGHRCRCGVEVKKGENLRFARREKNAVTPEKVYVACPTCWAKQEAVNRGQVSTGITSD